MTNWQNRIVGYGEEEPDQLLANPANWRIHPKHQQEALGAVLDNVGWVQNVIVNRRTGFVVDGHMRVALAISKGAKVPVTYVDLTPDEEALVLASFDPISAAAATDAQKLDELLQGVSTDSPALQKLLNDSWQNTAPMLYADEQRGKTPEELLEGYLNSTIKQIVLLFSNEEYDDVIRRLTGIRRALQAQNNTEVFLHLLEHYETHHSTTN